MIDISIKIIKKLNFVIILSLLTMFSCIFLCGVLGAGYRNVIQTLENISCNLHSNIDSLNFLFFSILLMFIPLITNIVKNRKTKNHTIKTLANSAFDFSEENDFSKLLFEISSLLIHFLMFVNLGYRFNHCGA